MDRRLITVRAGIIAGFPVAVAAKDSLPTNVKVRGNRVVDKIDWSFSPGRAVDFSKVKRCVAVNPTNDEIQLTDSAGSWVGPATGNYYQKGNSSTVAARDIFKIVDDQEKFLLAQGWIDKPVLAFRWILRSNF